MDFASRPSQSIRSDHRVRPGRPPPREAQIGAEREHEEEAGEHVLALGDPGHRLDVQRMDAEQRGDRRAPPRGARHPPQHLEEEPDAARWSSRFVRWWPFGLRA